MTTLYCDLCQSDDQEFNETINTMGFEIVCKNPDCQAVWYFSAHTDATLTDDIDERQIPLFEDKTDEPTRRTHIKNT